MREPDKAEFRLIFERTRNDVFHLIRWRVGSREDALDILQDVYLEFWKALGNGSFQYRSDPEFLGFLYLIAKRRIARFYRFRRLTYSLDDLDQESEDSHGQEADDGEVSLLLGAVGKLGSLDQEVIRLHYFSGLKFKEIGVLLGKEESAIKVRHHRAISRIKEILGYEKN